MFKTKKRLDELEAHIWLIERRLDGLRDDIVNGNDLVKACTYVLRELAEANKPKGKKYKK